jgi:hypothetical protein
MTYEDFVLGRASPTDALDTALAFCPYLAQRLRNRFSASTLSDKVRLMNKKISSLIKADI